MLTDAGFSKSGTFLTDGILDQWQSWQASNASPLPENSVFDWIARRTMSLHGPEFAACGVAIESDTDPTAVAVLIDKLAVDGVYMTRWHKLGEGLSQHALG